MLHEWNHKPDPIILLSREEEKRLKGDRLGLVKETIAGVRRETFATRFPTHNRETKLPNGFTTRIITPAVFGMELEVEYLGKDGRDANQLSYNWDQKASKLLMYFKKDSSLVNGFEIVSHPRSLESWGEIKNPFKDLLREMRDIGFRSYDTGRCGMHFHICRSAFHSEMHIAKFIQFWNQNHNLSYALSRRTPESMKKYAFIYKIKAEPITNLLNSLSKMKSRNQVGIQRWFGMPSCRTPHHAVVALTTNTVEVRLFRGTLNTSTILATIEMLQKLISITAHCGFSELDVQSIIKKIPDNKKNKRTIKMLSKSKTIDKEKISRDKDEKEIGHVGFKEYHERFRENLLKMTAPSGITMMEKVISFLNQEEINRIPKNEKKKEKKSKTMVINGDFQFLADDPVIADQGTMMNHLRQEIVNAARQQFIRVAARPIRPIRPVRPTVRPTGELAQMPPLELEDEV